MVVVDAETGITTALELPSKMHICGICKFVWLTSVTNFHLFQKAFTAVRKELR
jgi:hypothetical protein